MTKAHFDHSAFPDDSRLRAALETAKLTYFGFSYIPDFGTIAAAHQRDITDSVWAKYLRAVS